ncbi:MAG TPA: hypothetical protein VMF11_01140 [Candidatus Baltobacteraceae bacterium]|nr:hypothetical protein [Candidatus Baltobacteraceae bacterium]
MAVAIPLIVAVTGHRDIAAGADASLRERFGELIDQLARQYRWTPLTLLCGLRPGAEILAAEEALARGIPVIAALPMARERYEATFNQQEVARFRAVLAQCERVETVGAELPVHLAYYGDIVVLFWDGVEGSDETIAEVVTMRKSGIPSRHAILGTYVPDVGPAYQIVTPREGQPAPRGAFTLEPRCPDRFDGDKTCEHDFLAALDRYNDFDRDLSATPGDARTTSLADLMKRIDGAANRLQIWHLRIVQGLYILAFLAGAAQLVNEGPRGLEIKLGVLALAFACFVVARRFDFENRYQDYRALAEALRVQQAWRAAGLHLRVESEYLRMQQDELSWIRMALRTIYLLYVHDSHLEKNPAAVSGWIDDQRTYYANATHRQQQLARRYIVLGRMLTFLALAFSIPAAVALLMKYPGPWTPSLTSVPVAVAALAALLLRFYVQQRGFQENARRYHHMLFVFDYAQRRIAGMDSTSPKDAYDKTVGDLGKEALAEHASWLVLHRERPLNFVAT